MTLMERWVWSVGAARARVGQKYNRNNRLDDPDGKVGVVGGCG